jgi:hypothetical protein
MRIPGEICYLYIFRRSRIAHHARIDPMGVRVISRVPPIDQGAIASNRFRSFPEIDSSAGLAEVREDWTKNNGKLRNQTENNRIRGQTAARPLASGRKKNSNLFPAFCARSSDFLRFPTEVVLGRMFEREALSRTRPSEIRPLAVRSIPRFGKRFLPA